MRERIAVAISVVAVAMVVVLSTLFAARQNPPLEAAPAPAEADGAPAGTDTLLPGGLPIHGDGAEARGRAALPVAPVASPTDSARGRLVFRQQGCERCHSVAGEGSRRYPLDGVGRARTREQLRAWTVAEESVTDSLSPSAARAKRRYQQLPEADLQALLEYLGRLVHEP
jgi:mono/diheme cytochrome c family protein